MLIKIIVFNLLMTSTLFANTASAVDCRAAIVRAYTTLGYKVDPKSFSTLEFKDLNITIEEFNSLSSERQSEVYRLVRPLSISVELAVNALNDQISRVAGTYYEYGLLSELASWRSARQNLKTCK